MVSKTCIIVLETRESINRALRTDNDEVELCSINKLHDWLSDMNDNVENSMSIEQRDFESLS